MGCKQDPKYQTLPYNTKFGVRQQQHYSQTSATNQLCVSTPENDRIHSQVSNEKLLSTNSCVNNDNNNNHNNVSIITNNINSNPKLAINTKNSVLEERPSPSGSSGSSDRASIQNHNGILAYKMQQQIHNNINNMTSGQHPYQNVNPKMFVANHLEPNQNSINLKQTKLNHNSYNSNAIIGNYKMQSNSLNSNQSVIQSHSVPTNNQNPTQSQTTSIASKVPPNTKPKPIVPPKPSVPVKPIPPPRQSPIHLYGPQMGNESVDMNAFSTNLRNNSNILAKKSSNLLTASNTSVNTTSTGYSTGYNRYYNNYSKILSVVKSKHSIIPGFQSFSQSFGTYFE